MPLEREMPGERHGEGKENRECPVFCGVKEDEVIELNGRRGAVRCQGRNHLCRKSVWGKGEKLLHVAKLPRLLYNYSFPTFSFDWC